MEVTPSTSDNVFTFVMVSSNITIEIQEEDYSKYYGYYVTDKAWKFTQFGSYSSASTDTLSYTSLEKSLAFESNGSGTWDEHSFTWTQEANATSGAVAASLKASWGDSYEKTFYYTENLVVMNPSTYSSTSWYQVGVGTWNADATIHALALDDAGTRLFYTVDENDAIKESIVINNSTVTVNPTIYKDDSKTTLAKGSELSLTSTFYISLSADSGFGISNGKVIKAYSLGVGEGSSEQITVVYKNASGQAITEAKNGDTVTVCFVLSEEAAAAGLSIDTPTITVDDRWLKATLTPVEGEENTYTFVMPAAKVTVKVLTFNPNVYQGYAALGKYAGFELYGTTTKDVTNYSSAYGKFTREITKAGKFADPTSKTSPGNVKELTNSTKGTFVVSDDLDISRFNKKWFFGNGTIATFWSDSATTQNLKDTYVAVRVPDDFDPSTLTTKIHWMNNGSSWALEFYVSNVLAGGIFATNNTFYCGATFEMTGESTRIGKDATYTVKLDDQAIFTVANETVTAAE